ncbi:hypothetical protein JKP88DRAFT_272249 [Tribonema minus]|uniref:Uncharacterized protein n=1 Tax=Tribonema minus TaxID=303371 RepID=A0A835ZHH6_9STRA|nr:hypothetical protein JKP88DRAFT_272249 [Tribonema minus]
MTIDTISSPTAHLKARVVWVTGASSGLGEQLAIQAAAGAPKLLIISGRNEDALRRVAEACAAAASPAATDSRVLVVPFDVSDAGARERAAKEVLEAAGGAVDVLVNCAGVSVRAAVESTSMEVDRMLMETNFYSAVDLTKAVLPGMVNQKSGSIIAINSVQGKLGLAYRAGYSASKHALSGYCDALRAEVAPHGVRVLSACPGYVRTALCLNALRGDGSRHARMDASTAAGADPADVAASIWRGDAEGRGELVLAPLYVRVACVLRALAPWVVFRAAARRAEREAADL